jgi:hypothetical protein
MSIAQSTTARSITAKSDMILPATITPYTGMNLMGTACVSTTISTSTRFRTLCLRMSMTGCATYRP